MAKIKATIHLNNMICDCCLRVVRWELEQIDVQVIKLIPGQVDIRFDAEKIALGSIEQKLEENGFPVIRNKEGVLVEEIKNAVVALVHHTTFNAMIRNSDYLVDRFGKTYPYLSSLFSKFEGITLEKYIILHKIEKVKSLIEEDEITLSEIAFMMGYSSVQYLSTQFKHITGVSVSDFKKNPGKYRISIDKLGKDTYQQAKKSKADDGARTNPINEAILRYKW